MRENQKTINDWQESVLGRDIPVLASLGKLVEEFAELVEAAGYSRCAMDVENVGRRLRSLAEDGHERDLSKDMGEELADVAIVAYHLADMLGVDLHEAIDRKMAINRRRRWDLRPDGTAQHVEGT